jgi:hypothetical protein
MEQRNQNRRKFLFAGISLAAVWAAFRWGKQPEPPNTVRFLTHDGRLVEVDASKIPASKKAASKNDIQQWIKK